jgi:hypothetical protein
MDAVKREMKCQADTIVRQVAILWSVWNFQHVSIPCLPIKVEQSTVKCVFDNCPYAETS